MKYENEGQDGQRGGQKRTDSHLEIKATNRNHKSRNKNLLKDPTEKSLLSQRKIQVCKESRLNTFQEQLKGK